MDASTAGAILVFLVAVTIPVAAMLLSRLVGKRVVTEGKHTPFECGVDQPVGSARQRFSVKFYIVALLFLVFDLEVVFVFPWAVEFRELSHTFGLAAVAEMFVFLGILLLGYIYLFKKGALDWEK